MSRREADHFAQELLVHLAEDVRREHGELVGTIRIIKVADDLFKDLVIDGEPKGELVRGLGPAFLRSEVKQAGVVALVGPLEELA